MKINGEEVELVTSFDQLRAGMIVWLLECDDCGDVPTRHMIIRVGVDYFAHADRSIANADIVPRCKCGAQCFLADDVPEGLVYAVVDPELAATTTRKREAVRG